MGRHGWRTGRDRGGVPGGNAKESEGRQARDGEEWVEKEKGRERDAEGVE